MYMYTHNNNIFWIYTITLIVYMLQPSCVSHVLNLMGGTLDYVSDNEFGDFYSYWEKIRENSLTSLPTTAALISSVRMSSAKFTINPSSNALKQIIFRFKLCKWIV